MKDVVWAFDIFSEVSRVFRKRIGLNSGSLSTNRPQLITWLISAGVRASLNIAHMFISVFRYNLQHVTKSLSSRSLYNSLRIVSFPVAASCALFSTAMAQASSSSIFQFHVNDIDGNEVSLDKYQGYVTLIVNVASKWGLTKKNYVQLQELHQK